MKTIGSTIALCCLLATTTGAGTLSAKEAENLRADVAAVAASVERGESGRLIESTHSSVLNLVGGPEAFADMTRQAVEQLKQSGVKFLSGEVGTPTRTYSAGEEEVCFVPRVSVMELQGKKVKSTTFMIAVRTVGGDSWKYLDGAGLRDNPDLLYQLLPKLERGVPLPPINVEVL